MNIGYVIAPKQLVSKRLKVRFMYREKPDSKDDSGWRFFSGNETDEYVNNPENIGIYDSQTILAIDADVEPFLDAPYGSAFEREDVSKSFVASKEFSFE